MDTEHGYRYTENGHPPSPQDGAVWMTAKEAARRNRKLAKLPDSVAITRKWVMEFRSKTNAA